MHPLGTTPWRDGVIPGAGAQPCCLLPVCLAAALGTWCLVGAQSTEEGCWDKGKHCVRAQE